MTNLAAAAPGAGQAGATEVGMWVIVAFLVINGVGGLMGLLSFFATRREVDKLDHRVGKLEDTTEAVRMEMRSMKDDLVLSGDKRSSILHNRINPVVENLAAIKAGQEAFVASFNNFTRVMQSLVNRERETKECPRDNGK